MVIVRHRPLGDSEVKDSQEFEFPFDLKIHISNILKDSDSFFLYWADCTHDKQRINIIETAGLTKDPDRMREVAAWCVNQFEWLHVDAVITLNIFEFSEREHAEKFKAEQERYFVDNVR